MHFVRQALVLGAATVVVATTEVWRSCCASALALRAPLPPKIPPKTQYGNHAHYNGSPLESVCEAAEARAMQGVGAMGIMWCPPFRRY